MTHNRSMNAFTVRPIREADLPIVGSLGASLVRQHFTLDPQRFLEPAPKVEEGYAWFLGSQMREPDVVILVAESDNAVVGYVYAELEPHNWKELRGPAGFIHDVVVAETHQSSGIGAALIEAAIAWLKEHNAPRVILWTAEKNSPAQKLFLRLGFRRTMIEMTRELS